MHVDVSLYDTFLDCGFDIHLNVFDIFNLSSTINEETRKKEETSLRFNVFFTLGSTYIYIYDRRGILYVQGLSRDEGNFSELNGNFGYYISILFQL